MNRPQPLGAARQDKGNVRVLTVTTLYPNAIQPNHGVFVENRLRQTLALGGVEAVVIAPVPYFPFRSDVFGSYAKYARVPREETRHGIRVLHPRYLVLPKIGMQLTPGFLSGCILKSALKLRQEGFDFDVIDAHYFYPDGVAAARLGKKLGKPLVITGRGTDLTLIPKFAGPRRQIQWAARQAGALVTVCEALKDRLKELGIEAGRVQALRNGVDLTVFAPRPREAARARLGLTQFTLLTVGGLIPRKGQYLVIEALTQLPDCTYLIAGGGPMRGELEALARKLGVANRVKFLGEVPHGQLAEIYSAADVSVLASEREGWANVLLESMACGTPVVATEVDGTAEVLRDPAAGRLIRSRSPDAIAAAIKEMRSSRLDREATYAYARGFGWKPIAEANRRIFERLARGEKPVGADLPPVRAQVELTAQ